MGDSGYIIRLLQIGVYFITIIIIGLIGLYIFLISKKSMSQNKDYGYTNSGKKDSEYDDFLREKIETNNNDDDGPIQNL